MSLSIIRNPEFAGVDVTGRKIKIFDLSLVATIPQNSSLYTFIGAVQDRALALGYHTLPAGQTHVTVVNPLYMKEKQGVNFTDVENTMFNQPEEQRILFSTFSWALKNMSENEMFDRGWTLSASDILFRPKDLKILMPADGKWKELGRALTEQLKKASPWFDFAEGDPLIRRGETDYAHTTVLKFPMDIDAAKHEALIGIVEDEAGRICGDLTFEVGRQNLLAVMLTGLFVPWVREAAIIRGK